MRYDLAFFLCCCRSFLGDGRGQEDDYYQLLGVERDASPDELRRAFKKKSLSLHPDKLAQRGQTVTDEDQAKFTRMKEAYEVLNDPHKRETYDAIGARGLKWVEEPFSVDPQELAHNFANSSVLDRAKIFSIFVGAAIAVLLLPFLVCLHVDGAFGENAKWMATLVPLWMWNVFLVFYHVRVIQMSEIPRPDHIPPEEWVDPLPMEKRYFSFFRFFLIFMFEILAVLKLDDRVQFPWAVVFIPMYIWEATTLYKKWPMARMKIVTVEDLEAALGKPFAEFTPAERELISHRYSVVPSTTSPEFEVASKQKGRARHEMIQSIFRAIFSLLLIIQLDGDKNWSWWWVFTPFWVMTFLICYANFQAFSEVQQMAMVKDPSLFGLEEVMTPGGSADENGNPTNYGSVGVDGEATPQDAGAQTSSLSEEEREELKAQVMASGSRLINKCCSQCCLLILVCMFVAKLQGAGFSSIWIISPFLLAAGIILCCLGCAIFGITEVPTDGVEFDTGDLEQPMGSQDQAQATAAAPPGTSYDPPNKQPGDSTASSSIPDPESGGIITEPAPHASASSHQTDAATSPPFDLLDSPNVVQATEAGSPDEINELD